MHNAYIVTGTLTDEKTVKLDEALPVEATKVRLVIELIATPSRRSVTDVLTEIWEGQKAHGHVPPTREEVDAYLKAERDSWDE